MTYGYERKYMKTSTEINSAARSVGEEKAIELIAKAGFDAWDFSMFKMISYDWGRKTFLPSPHELAGENYLAYARKLAHIGKECGIVCNQSHAPFPSTMPYMMPFLKRSVECTAEAGGKICVIHPDNFKSAAENAEMFLELLPFAKDCGVKIAVENMWNWDDRKDEACFAACMTPGDFKAHLDAVNDDYFVACVDIGHCEMRGTGTSAVEMIRSLGSKVQALHIHDNDRHHDSHKVPFTMDIDFPPIVDALADIGYDGYFTLECDAYLPNLKDMSIEDGINVLAGAARKLADMFDAKGTRK